MLEDVSPLSSNHGGAEAPVNGRVCIVGAGPGDPELLTVKAVNRMRAADVVLHDALVSEEVLALISRTARVIKVGKRCGCKSISQDEINALLIGFATAGNRVVRLKNGDPLIFGRSGEEIAALTDAGIKVEVVPGITAALAAAASTRISLTDRRHAEQVLLVSAHHACGKPNPDWAGMISPRTTTVIYMPGQHQRVAQSLMRAGVCRDTPCIVISHISRREEEAYQTTLGNLRDTEQLPAPCLLIVGETTATSAQRGRRPTSLRDG